MRLSCQRSISGCAGAFGSVNMTSSTRRVLRQAHLLNPGRQAGRHRRRRSNAIFPQSAGAGDGGTGPVALAGAVAVPADRHRGGTSDRRGRYRHLPRCRTLAVARGGSDPRSVRPGLSAGTRRPETSSRWIRKSASPANAGPGGGAAGSASRSRCPAPSPRSLRRARRRVDPRPRDDAAPALFDTG